MAKCAMTRLLDIQTTQQRVALAVMVLLSFVSRQTTRALSATRSASTMPTRTLVENDKAVFVPESTWRTAANHHQERIYALLQPGLLPSGALDPYNPIFNFLREYYGLKGIQGVRKLALWSPLSIHGTNSVLLENANLENDNFLPLKGATPNEHGVIYSIQQFDNPAPYIRYRAVIKQTLTAEPNFFCFGLHEWAMQYTTSGDTKPPSAKYQAHLPLRVSQATINATVERKGVHCTHVDALKYFSKEAKPLNKYGKLDEEICGNSGCDNASCDTSPRMVNQLRFEQPACVHAQMDMLKMALRLQPYLVEHDQTSNNSSLIVDILDLALRARRLDIAASPYDATAYGLEPVCIETHEGRAIYKQRQQELAVAARPIRLRLLESYRSFIAAAFEQSVIDEAEHEMKIKSMIE